MRLHTLDMTAFGPFADTQTLDFEELNDAGVFLITGPTGAGKTSILDAVCFALFGEVPGARDKKSLKSHHSPSATKPEVRLEVTLGGRRFVVRRTPAWTRPKKRGVGVTEENASASLLEVVDGQEVLRSSRADEVGHEIRQLLGGMNATQFQQVALLPQGEFQTFLQAASEDRRKVLQQLFRTDRFARIEEWFADHTRRLKDATADDEAAVRRLVDTMADRAGVEAPDAFAGDRLGPSAADGSVLTWARSLVVSAADSVTVAAAQADQSAAADADVRAALEAGELLSARWEKVHVATATVASLQDDPSLREAAILLDADTRARRGDALIDLLDDAADRVDLRQQEHDQLVARMGAHHCPTDRADLTTRRDSLRALAPSEAELGRLLAETETLGARLVELDHEVGAQLRELDALPTERSALDARLDQLRESAATREARSAAVTDAAGRLAASQELAEAEASLDRLRADAVAHAEAYNDARERALELTERRLAGMAAELAGGLAEGEPCQVCGSTHHPAPAAPAPDAVDAGAHQSAQARAAALRPVHESARRRVDEAAIRVAGLVSLAQGRTPADAAAEHAEAVAALTEADSAAAELPAVVAALAAVDARGDALRTTLAAAEKQQGALSTALALARQRAGDLQARFDELVDEGTTLSAALAATEQALADVDALARASEDLVTAREQRARLESAARSSARDSGFATLEEARTALLDDSTRSALLTQVETVNERLAAARAVLADPDHAALPAEPPETEPLREEARAVAAALRDALRDLDLARDRSQNLDAQLAELDAAITRWRPAHARLATAQSLTRLVRGNSADNQLQMRLSSYVLATRLDQVIDAANARLREMRDQRYQMVRTPEAGRRGSQAGLDLRVVDAWTGEERSPASLSGGECFVVSLALALGLSDVVTAEAGGVELSTLFVDEGFGMLDLDTLDDVMDRLDELRAGGRTVGVVSHVTELRARIPTQVQVDKHQHGSTVQVRTLIA